MNKKDVIGRQATVTRELVQVADTNRVREYLENHPDQRHRVWTGAVEDAHVCSDRCGCKPPAGTPGELTGACLDADHCWKDLMPFDIFPGELRVVTTIEFNQEK